MQLLKAERNIRELRNQIFPFKRGIKINHRVLQYRKNHRPSFYIVIGTFSICICICFFADFCSN